LRIFTFGGLDIVSAFVNPNPQAAGFVRPNLTEEKPIAESRHCLQQTLGGGPGAVGTIWTILGKGTVRAVQVADVRASFNRHYRAKSGIGKSPDGLRQARAMKGVLEEGMVKQESWEKADWIWREDE
jgi:hypothetical protein